MGVRKAATPRLVSPRTGVGGTGGPAGMRLRPRPGSGASWHSHRLVATFRWIIDVFTKLLNPRLMIRYTLNNPFSTKETVPVPVPETCVSRMNFIPTIRTFIFTVQYDVKMGTFTVMWVRFRFMRKRNGFSRFRQRIFGFKMYKKFTKTK